MVANLSNPPYATHQVENQPPPLENYDVFGSDRCLGEAVRRDGAGWAESRLKELGALAGSARVMELRRLANQYAPTLRTHDRYGNRIDEVEFHTAWHELMAIGMKAGVHALAWSEPRPGAHVARAALAFLMNQAENGVCCPFAMTFASLPALRHQPDIAAEWQPLLCSGQYDKRAIPASEKTAVTFGMAMTEKQGGSDVRANSTRAAPVGAGGPGAEYASSCSASRTSSATVPTLLARSSITTPGPAWWARRVAACPSSLRWCTVPGSTPPSRRPRSCARRCLMPFTMPPTARHSSAA
jgi:putative acyl-CoA dehydrogenase